MKDYLEIEKENSRYILHKGVFSDIARQLIDEDNDFELKSLSCRINDSRISLDADLKVRSGIDVNANTMRLQRQLYDLIRNSTGVSCERIDLKIVGFVF